MSQPVFRVLQPGLHTTIQDRGRFGFRHLGVPVSGPMDAFSFEVANCLVGNCRNTPALEILLHGPQLQAGCDAVIAICGADLSPTIDEQPVPLWKTIAIGKGQTLAFGKPRVACIAYLAVAGGFSTPRVMNSTSTYVRGGFGGMHGDKLRAGDTLNANAHLQTPVGRSLAPAALPNFGSRDAVRVILGPQDELFDIATQKTFFNAQYIVAGGDRMGYRLLGPPLNAASPDILTDAVAPGAIQVPSDGQPIVLLADAQTTGGYPKLATVISVDLWRVAQLLPRQSVRFCPVGIDEAQSAAAAQEDFLRKLETALHSAAN